MDPSSIMFFLQTYGYPLMFILMYIEGPIVTLIASFLASFGVFNIGLVWLLSFLGDLTSDIVHLLIGHKWHQSALTRMKEGGKMRIIIKRLQRLLHKNLFYSLLIIKISPPPISTTGLFLAGTLKKRRLVIAYAAIISLALESCIIMLGYFSGSYFQSVLKDFRETSIIVMVLAGIAAVAFILKHLLGKMSENKIRQE